MRRVVLIGSESTGKTTLAERLAQHYGVDWVPEFVRDYAAQKNGVLTFDDHGPIARGQIALEEERRARAIACAAPLLLQDTDLLSTAVYCAHYYGNCPTWIADTARERRPDLYLLLDIDIPWQQDPQRDRGDLRSEMHALFLDAVRRSGVPYTLISGDRDSRFAMAQHAIDELLSRRR